VPSLPSQEAAIIDPGNPRRFLRSIKWKKARDGFFHGQRDRILADWSDASANQTA